MRHSSLFEGSLSTLAEAIELTAQSLVAPGKRYRHWAIAFSCGKGFFGGRHGRRAPDRNKIEPMHKALAGLRAKIGEKLLMLTGVRMGESVARDERIVTTCSRDNAECGQGWLQIQTPEAICDTLAPAIHWRVCHVWAWLTAHAPARGFPTPQIAGAYGGDEAAEAGTRTGCVGCPLASEDRALDAVVKINGWTYLHPLKRLRPLYEKLRFTRAFRLRKPGTETLKDGSIGANPQRLGPLTMDARLMGLQEVLSIQWEIGRLARALGRPTMELITAEEENRIRELISDGTRPNKWSGEEPPGDALVDRYFADGTVQPKLFQVEGGVA